MLVRAKVINDAGALFAVDHVGVKATLSVRPKCTNPRNCFPSKWIYIRVIVDLKWHIPTTLREHDSAPRSYIQKWQRIWRPMPDFVHYSGTHRSNVVLT